MGIKEGTEDNREGSTGKPVTADQLGRTGVAEPSKVAASRVTPVEPAVSLGELADNEQAVLRWQELGPRWQRPWTTWKLRS